MERMHWYELWTPPLQLLVFTDTYYDGICLVNIFLTPDQSLKIMQTTQQSITIHH